MRGTWLVWMAAIWAVPAAAQTDCTAGHLPYNSNEAQLLRKFEVPLAFGASGAPTALAPGQVQLGVDVTYLPHIDSTVATPTYCRPGKPPEHVNLLFGVPRPRVTIGLPADLALELSWVPPVRVNGVKANLFGFALSRRWALGPMSHLTARAHGSVGRIDATITCTADQIKPSGPPQCAGLPAPSDDRFYPDLFGVEGMMDWAPAGWPWHPYAGIGVNVERPRFQVDPANTLVNQPVEGNYLRPALFGGGTIPVRPGVGVDLSFYAIPGDAVTWRAGGRWTL